MGRKALVIELAGGTQWLLISTRAQFRGLLGMLRKDGLREAHLREALEGAAGELEEGMGEGAGDAPGAMGLCEKGTTDDDLNAFLEDRIDCHAPDAGR